MECDSPDCKAAGKVCDALGIQFVADIEIVEAKESLDERVNKNQRIKNQQMKFYADDVSTEEVMTKRGHIRFDTIIPFSSAVWYF